MGNTEKDATKKCELKKKIKKDRWNCWKIKIIKEKNIKKQNVKYKKKM
jgi:hypothetical protein